MIKSPHSYQTLVLKAQSFYQNIVENLKLAQNLDNYKEIVCSQFAPYFLNISIYLRENLVEIIVGDPEKLESHIPLIDEYIRIAANEYIDSGNLIYTSKKHIIDDSDKKLKRVIKLIHFEISKIFNYDFDSNSFVKLNNGKLAYDHAEDLEMNTCPYCNANFTYTLRDKVKFRPQFDHFLRKSSHPYFALSFFNLIPSCAFCNSGALKGMNDFRSTTHIHPFMEDIEEIYKFKIDIESSDFVNSNKKFEIELVECINCDLTRLDKAKENIRVFGLKERYRFHKDIAGLTIKTCYVYNEGLENLYKSFGHGDTKIFDSMKEIRSLIKSTFLLPQEYHKRALSKLSKDIADEFNIFL